MGWRPCWQQVSTMVSSVSTKRLPAALWVPWESLRQRPRFGRCPGVAERAFDAVVRRFDPFDFGEPPELIEVCQQVVTPRDCRGVRTPLPVLQGVIDLRPAVAFDPFSQRGVADAPGARALPELEPLLQRGPQSFADDVLAVAARIESILEVSIEVCPTELAATV